MKPYTGIEEDQRVNVEGFAGVKRTEDALELVFTNEGADSGRTTVRVPFNFLELILGSDLAHWLAIALPDLNPEDGGLVIKSKALLFTYLEGGNFVMLFVDDKDEKTIAVAMPKAEAKRALGSDLCARLLERGDQVRRYIMQRYNDSLAKSE